MHKNLSYSNTNGSAEEPFKEAINSASDIVGSYIIPSVSAIGVILNIFSIFILNHRSLKHNFYKYLICKSIINLLTCVVGMGFTNSYCRQCSFDENFEMLLYRNYGICIPIRILLLTSVLSEIYLNINRYFTIVNTRLKLTTIKIRYYIFFIFFIPICLKLPLVFFTIIQHDAASNVWVYSLSKSLISQLYLIILFLFEYLALNIVLVVSIIAVRIKYKQRIRIKSLNLNKFHKYEKRFTMMVMSLNVIFLLVRTFDTTTETLYRIKLIYSPEDSVDFIMDKSFISALRTLAISLMFTMNAFNIILVFYIDKNLKAVIRSYFTRDRVANDSFNNRDFSVNGSTDGQVFRVEQSMSHRQTRTTQN